MFPMKNAHNKHASASRWTEMLADRPASAYSWGFIRICDDLKKRPQKRFPWGRDLCVGTAVTLLFFRCAPPEGKAGVLSAETAKWQRARGTGACGFVWINTVLVGNVKLPPPFSICSLFCDGRCLSLSVALCCRHRCTFLMKVLSPHHHCHSGRSFRSSRSEMILQIAR